MPSLPTSQSPGGPLPTSQPASSPLALDDKFRALLDSCSAQIRELLHATLAGEQLSFDQALRLATCEGPTLNALIATADALRRQTVGDTITYVVNRNLNFTNVCFVGCSFCGFGKGPSAPDAYFLSFDEVVDKARDAWEKGASEVCIQGGLPRDPELCDEVLEFTRKAVVMNVLAQVGERVAFAELSPFRAAF